MIEQPPSTQPQESADIRHPGEKEKTKLSTHCWDLQARGKDYNLEWKIIDRATTFNPTTKKCRVCLKEKTKLSTHCWDLQARGKDYNLEWKIIDKATTFNPTTKKCRVCLKEKYHIMYSKDSHPLNKRQEVFSTCRHMAQKRLSNVE